MLGMGANSLSIKKMALWVFVAFASFFVGIGVIIGDFLARVDF